MCSVHGCRVVHFMVHDRVSFGGTLISIGTLYLWLTRFSLRRGEAWAWWTLALSGAVGFASFFAYLGYGYLDTWHGLATLGLLPLFAIGLMLTWHSDMAFDWLVPTRWGTWKCRFGIGRVCLLVTAAGLIAAGATILAIGMTWVFVPEDLAYMQVTADELTRLNPRLVPLIAHDRAGFGGAVCCTGLTVLCSVWRATPTRGLWWSLAIAGVIGFGSAIGVHPAIGYTDPFHLGPAILGAALYAAGLFLTFPRMVMAATTSPEQGEEFL